MRMNKQNTLGMLCGAENVQIDVCTDDLSCVALRQRLRIQGMILRQSSK